MRRMQGLNKGPYIGGYAMCIKFMPMPTIEVEGDSFEEIVNLLVKEAGGVMES